MRCEDVRPALLDADVDVLSGTGSGSIAEHLRECSECRQAASRILHATQQMRTVLSAAVDERIRMSRPAGTVGPRSAGQSGRTRTGRRPSLRRALGGGIGLAAALAAALLAGRNSAERPADVYLAPPDVPGTPVVNVTGGSGVAVIETTNPDITVIWSF